MGEARFRCRKCRTTLFTSADVVSAHGEPRRGHVVSSCPVDKTSTVWYIRDDEMVDWMKEQVTSGEWIKGKLYCPSCNARLGSYDFVTGAKCACSEFVLPPIHVSKCRVDCDQAGKTGEILRSIVWPPLEGLPSTEEEI